MGRIDLTLDGIQTNPIREGSTAMFIWRNLDPKLLAQLLVQASAIWKARNAATRTRRSARADAALQPSAKRRDGRGSAGDV